MTVSDRVAHRRLAALPDAENGDYDLQANRLSSTTALAGRSFVLHFQDGQVARRQIVRYAFTESDVSWRVLEGPTEGAEGSAAYDAVPVRKDIFFLDFVNDPQRHRGAAWVLDLPRRRAVVANASFLERSGRIRPDTEVLTAGVDREAPASVSPTKELAGKRILWTYSENTMYEHIYMATMAVWQSLANYDRFDADAEEAWYYEIEPGLVLVNWYETVMIVGGFFLVDLEAMRSTGRFFGWAADVDESFVLRFGAKGRLLNETTFE
jgi:molybdenum cofactor biosynthesis protein MoaF